MADLLCRVAEVAPHFPLYYYHIPFMNTVDVNVEQALTMANKRCPNVLGVKYTSNDVQKYSSSFFEKFNVLNGFDPAVYKGIKLGADGAIGIGFNFFGAKAFDIYTNVK